MDVLVKNKEGLLFHISLLPCLSVFILPALNWEPPDQHGAAVSTCHAIVCLSDQCSYSLVASGLLSLYEIRCPAIDPFGNDSDKNYIGKNHQSF